MFISCVIFRPTGSQSCIFIILLFKLLLLPHTFPLHFNYAVFKYLASGGGNGPKHKDDIIKKLSFLNENIKKSIIYNRVSDFRS